MKHILSVVFVAASVLTACTHEFIPNPNAPTMEEIIKNPSISQLNNLVTGSEGGLRAQLGLYHDLVGVFGREFWRYSNSDSRNTEDLLGKGNITLDPNSYYAINSWLARYSVVKNCNLLMEATKNCTLLENEAQKNGYYAFAKTIAAYQLLLNLNHTDDQGIRTDVNDPKDLGPIVNKTQALTDIAKLLDDADVLLNNATIIFPLSDGFEGFNSVAGFKKFNRALSARVSIYREQWTKALTDLNGSFLDLSAGSNLNTGVYHVFSSSSGDLLNELYLAPDGQSDIRAAHPTFEADLEAGDDRINKTHVRAAAATFDGLTSTRDVALYATPTTPVAIIRNEELILIYAEAKLQNNALAEAADALNTIRSKHNLTPRLDLDTKAKLIDELLKQRRYSLFGEGHRWVDMRRYNRLATLPIDRAGDDVWPRVPLPAGE
ncbi:RagB/SusD family nutrient uptake outer membrane protein [Chitinophaga niabensis]|uniref:SusD family protein n=1 Tax=Chitinophaga niabensis TaxID=536979 RepID=A0A1N6EMX2_9BACT|nr:RagB/SusD family nutrient uptake outer membrane protein [Chitinophaga niabensis]SIN84291.1 SusD family protein [Chitinophaga niabensis]